MPTNDRYAVFAVAILASLLTLPACKKGVREYEAISFRLTQIPWDITTRTAITVAGLGTDIEAAQPISDTNIVRALVREVDSSEPAPQGERDFRMLALISKGDGDPDTLAIPKTCGTFYFNGKDFILRPRLMEILCAQMKPESKIRMRGFGNCDCERMVR